MATNPMPGGPAVWHRDLEGADLDQLFGFIDAYVVCPKDMHKPFLPYRQKDETLLFPKGDFVGTLFYRRAQVSPAIGI